MKPPATVRHDQATEAADAGVSIRPIGLGTFVAVLRQNLFWIAAATLGALILAVAILQLVPLRYQAQASLVVSVAHPARPVDGTVVLTHLAEVSKELIASVRDEITAPPIVRKVVADLNLQADPEFNPHLAGGTRFPATWTAAFDEAVDVLSRLLPTFAQPQISDRVGLEVMENVRRAIGTSAKVASHTITVSATTMNPEKSAAIANALVSAYLQHRLETQQVHSRRLEQWLGDRLAELRQQVRVQEDEVERVRARIGHYQGETSTIFSEQLSQLSRQLLETKDQLANAEAKRSQLRQLADGAPLSSVDDVLNSELIQKLRQQEAHLLVQRAGALSQLGPRHPSLVSIHQEVAQAREKIATEIARIDQKISDQIRILRDKANTLETEQRSLQTRIEAQNAALVQLRQLQNDANSSRDTYTAMSTYRARVAGAPTVEQTSVSVISNATPPLKAAWPNQAAILALTGVGAFFLSAVAVFLRATFAQDLRSAEQAWALLGLPTLALIPQVRLPKPIDRAVVGQPRSALSESIRYLYTSIQGRSAQHDGCFRVLVSSAVPDEGKTTTARMLAREAALVGASTLLVNLDLRRRTSRKADQEDPFGIRVETEADTGLHVLDVHSRDSRSFAFLHQAEFWEYLEKLGAHYKFMIIDSPPVLTVSDGATIARFAHSTIFVVRWGRTRIAAVTEALRQLRSANAVIQGIVLTQVDVRKHAMYGFGDSGVYTGAHRKYYLS